MTPLPNSIEVPVRAVLDSDGVPSEITAELATMSSVAGMVAMLDEAARWRVIAWLVDFFQIPLTAPDHFEPVQTPDEAAQRAVVAAAANWAAGLVAEMNPDELEQTVLEAQGWGDSTGLIEGALPVIESRLRKAAELAADAGEAPWPST